MLMTIHTKSIKIQPSITAYIAKGIALVGKGERHIGYQACDIAFEHFHSSHFSFLLLIKVCIPCIQALRSLYVLGYPRVHGWRARRCDIPRRHAHRHGAV